MLYFFVTLSQSSLPSRERGLKSDIIVPVRVSSKSLPSRERGLKFENLLKEVKEVDVAPFAGAWIEISVPGSARMSIASLPSRERGLKSRSRLSDIA